MASHVNESPNHTDVILSWTGYDAKLSLTGWVVVVKRCYVSPIGPGEVFGGLSHREKKGKTPIIEFSLLR